MALNASSTMSEYPINLEWTIAEKRLKALKDSTKNEFLQSEKFTAIHSSDVQYFLRIYPNGNKESNRGKTWVFLWVKLENEKTIEAGFILSVKSAEWSHKFNFTFEESYGRGISCCTVAELFDSDMEFIVKGKLTLKVEGILKIEKAESTCARKILQPKRQQSQSLRDLWNTDFEDFVFVVEEKKIKVHKCVLAVQSPVFARMFKSGMRETIENEVVIPDFTFEIVEKAIKLCYKQLHVSDCSVEESLLLLKFADKYDIAVLQSNLEKYLGDQITVENFCEISNGAIDGNALKLQNKCMDFLVLLFAKKEVVPNLELLYKDFLIGAVKNFVQILHFRIFS
uniref:BTB domain-containing protein n=1 Tax=Panagrolaimus sp. PS1159 TaxID=55785 RepID=A0AC35FWK7_9BILA